MVTTRLIYTRRARVARRTNCVEFHQIRCNLWISLYTNPIPESAKFCSESIQFDQKVRIWCFFLISLYTNPIPESAKNRISNCSDETLKTQFLRAWRPKPGQMSNTEVMSPYRRTDSQTNTLFLRLSTQWALRAIIFIFCKK